MTNPRFLKELPYTFKNPALLQRALTHPSSERSSKLSEFERLEFLGDRVLGVLVAQMVYERYRQEKEGDLAKRFAALVCREACLQVAVAIHLSEYIIASLEESSPHSVILADAVEALIGALYLDGGLESAASFINLYWTPLLEKDILPPKDAKTALQELAQGNNAAIVPVYEVLEHTGPAHTPTFRVRVTVSGLGEAEGIGPSKRQAEQMAARLLLEGLEK